MANSSNSANQSLLFIKQCIQAGKVFWTYHVNMRLSQRSIPRRVIIESVDSLAIIESYPDDKPFSSYLIRGENAGIVFHILAATDVVGGNIRIITAYIPDTEMWDEDFRTRRGGL